MFCNIKNYYSLIQNWFSQCSYIFWDSTSELLCISLYFYECNSIILLPVPASSTFPIISGLIISIGQSLTYNHHHRRQQTNMKKKSRFCYAANYYEITLYYTINNNNSHGILFWPIIREDSRYPRARTLSSRILGHASHLHFCSACLPRAFGCCKNLHRLSSVSVPDLSCLRR